MEKKKVKKLNSSIEHLFKMVTEKDFLVNKGGILYLGGRALDEKETLSLVEQAKTIKSFPLWQIMLNEMVMAANKKIFFESVEVDDIVFGKAALWALDVFAKKVDNLSNFRNSNIKKQNAK